LGDLTFGSRENLSLFADGTSNNPIILFYIATDFVTRAALGTPFAKLVDPTNAANACFGIGVNWGQISLCRTLVNIGQDIARKDIKRLFQDVVALATSEELRLALQTTFGISIPAGLRWLINIYQVLELTLGTLLSPESDALIFQATATSAGRPNQPPLIQKIEAQPSIVRPGGTSTISVVASDPEGDPLMYTWSASGGTLSGTSGPEDKIWTAPDKLGIYEIKISITDNQQKRNPVTTSVRIQVSLPLNRLPIANAGPDQNVLVDSTVQLDGSGSSDPDGDKLTCSWKFISRPRGSKARLSPGVIRDCTNPSSPKPTFKADKVGDYIVELKVDDGRGGTATDQVKITAKIEQTCTITVNPGQSIQAAIDGATEGAVICLTAGTWKEDLLIEKSLTLRGVGRDQTILKGLSPVIAVIEVGTIVSGEVNIKDLTIDSSDNDGDGITIHGPTRVDNSIISNARPVGIEVIGNIQFTLTNSIIFNNGIGLRIIYALQVTINSSTIASNTFQGIVLDVAPSTAQVEIRQSTIENNGTHPFCKQIDWRCNGLEVLNYPHVLIVDSLIRNNTDWGVATWLKKCGYLEDAFSGQVIFQGNNTITGNNTAGNHTGEICLPDLASSSSQFITFLSQAESIRDIQVSIFNLSGRLVFHTDWVDNGFTWNLLDNQGQPLANGVYLYVITYRREDGTILRSEVKKLVILR
jgi:hypothetical protein